ncbi:acyl-CoA N-acyltransferase [Mycena rebaudengoi]|nr:acyl-CoA N-acyltransferase [Mycena rebaudengoi]
MTSREEAEPDLSKGSPKIETANKARATTISKKLRKDTNNAYIFKVLHAADLTEDDKSSVWRMFESNMRAMYTNSSFGWNPPEKREELFNPHSRFILVYPKDHSAFVAFTAFRFEHEAEEDILYCYDLHVSETARRQGLGRALMGHLESIGSSFGLERIMLTVFKVNQAALKLYEDLGFELDEDSPGDEDYKIMTKML